jgi:hypothetical protein
MVLPKTCLGEQSMETEPDTLGKAETVSGIANHENGI